MNHRMLIAACVAASVAAAARPAGAAAPSAGPFTAATVWTGADAAINDPDDRGDDLYDEGREAIEDGKYERAVDRFTRLADMRTSRTDAALYWKAYSLSKLGRRADALGTLADLQQRFKDSRWLKDAKALEVELRQASGQPVSPETQSDEELKLMALRALMQSDADRALPVLEQLLSGNSSPKVKDRALFVLSQSNSAKAREVIGNVAKGSANPDLQLRAIRYIGMMADNQSRQLLADVYRASTDPAVKRAVLRSYMMSGDRERLLVAAKSETAPELRGEAVQQLGVMGASDELAQMYQTETSADVKKRILQAMFVGGASAKLIDLAKTERDPQLRTTAIRNLGLMPASQTGDALTSIYRSDTNADVRKAVINALFVQSNGHAMVELARAEKDPQMKKDLVAKMSNMGKSKEVTDFLMELLK